MIRRGSLQDISLLQQLGKETFAHTFGNTCTKEDMRGVLETYFNTEQVRAELSDDSDHFFFHETQGIAQGYMRINAKHACPIESIQDLRCIELMRLYVLADYHGKGVANALMEYAFDFARTNGYQVMYLSVWEYNFRARGFYEKHGFINSGIENDFPLGSTPQTDYWFVKRL